MNYNVYITPETQIWAKVDEDVWVCRFNADAEGPGIVDNEGIWEMYAKRKGVLLENGKRPKVHVRGSEIRRRASLSK